MGMRKICLVFLGLFLCIESVDAAVRTQNTPTYSQSRQSTIQRTRTETAPTRSVSARGATINNIARNTTTRTKATKTVTGRTATRKSATRTILQPTQSTRAATIQSRTFGNNYNTCRDAYFTCMDQFCATQNEYYRRCVCSSKLQDIQNAEKKLSQTGDSLKDFQDLNIDVISKTSDEVAAMLTPTSGETAIKKDTSNSKDILKNISSILSEAKTKSLSTQGKLDIAGNIKSIWRTTDLIGGADIANLTGETLYNAVHTQCAELVANDCAESDLKMISSAYGMYIENDCSVLETNLKEKTIAANATIRDARHKMQDTRLDNYNTHNSTTINDCIANVRNDITANAACGENYVHCLDFSGKYINITTGEPIYSPEFYQIENQISLSGDILKNEKNVTFVNMLNKRRSFATKSLDSCRENSDAVWDEFMRQALVEIFQAQRARVQNVKNECLSVVNKCYLKQSEQLKTFSDTDTTIGISQIQELSEEMCNDKLTSCSNLYGGGVQGLDILVATMTSITNATIEQSCKDLLNTFVENLCAVPGNDSAHSSPYGCRAYAPGEAHYARNTKCNTTFVNPFSKTNILVTGTNTQSSYSEYQNYTKSCSAFTKHYTHCNPGYYLYKNCDNNDICYSETNATECRQCPVSYVCYGGTNQPTKNPDAETYDSCGQYYIGSLYQQLVIYALQNCTRSNNTENVPSASLLADIDNTMNDTRQKLVISLAKECETQKGTWVNIPWEDANNDAKHDTTGDSIHNNFYISTGTNALWGYCKQ